MNDSNNLEWKCILQGRGECRLPLEYTVEWPKDKRVEFKQLVKTEILKRQPTILSTTYTTTTPSPVHANSLDSQSTTSKGSLSYCLDIP
ncbi:unnamed protein product [Rotaria sordida]|uniref:Uncharacterized protein n=1 Tax=Rotaria sordida TaxID=392033 RepID=A0A815MXU5_9BILA|nr:unnamed protein product [Rotaria sordida]